MAGYPIIPWWNRLFSLTEPEPIGDVDAGWDDVAREAADWDVQFLHEWWLLKTIDEKNRREAN